MATVQQLEKLHYIQVSLLQYIDKLAVCIVSDYTQYRAVETIHCGR
jgi:hypothetical protein